MAVDTKKRNDRQYKWQTENADRINALLPKGMKAEINEAAAAQDVSASEFIRQAIREKIEDVKRQQGNQSTVRDAKK